MGQGIVAVRLAIALRFLAGLIIVLNLGYYSLVAAVKVAPGLPALWRQVNKSSPFCTRWQVVRDSLARRRLFELRSTVANSSRVISKEGGLELWSTPDGNFWMPAAGRGSWSEPLLPLLLAQMEYGYYGDKTTGVRPGDVVIDCGAHVGTFARHALQRGAKLVVAVEPAAGAQECIRRSFAAEIKSGRLILISKGIWDKEDNLVFYDNGNSDAANSFVVRYGDSRAIRMPVTSIDLLVKDLGLERVDFIKTDIKGATEAFLRGSASTIGRFRPRMALATEEPPEDPGVLVEMVHRLRPDYKVRCGACFLVEDQLRNEAVLFY